MIDLHCHFLPGVDDGAETLDQALALARAAVADGIVHSVMTPHIHPGVFENRQSELRAHLAAFQGNLARAQVPLKISLGGEVRIGPELIELLAEDQIPFLGALDGDKVMLLELPHGSIPVGSDRLVKWLRSRNIRPLIAHPERNKGVMGNIDKIRPFLDAGCLLQVTAGSLSGRFGASAQTIAREMLDRDWIFAIATDAHNLEHRPPMMSEGRDVVAELVGKRAAEILTLLNPARLVGAQATIDSPRKSVAVTQ